MACGTANQIADPSVAEANYDCGRMDGINYAAPGAQQYLGIFNTGTASRQRFRVRLSQLGIDRPIRVTDLWTGRSAGTYTTAVAPGGVTLISATPA